MVRVVENSFYGSSTVYRFHNSVVLYMYLNVLKSIFSQFVSISGDIESDSEKEKVKETPKPHTDLNISHEDLSDVSDLEDSLGHSDDDKDANVDIATEHHQHENEERKNEPAVQRVSKEIFMLYMSVFSLILLFVYFFIVEMLEIDLIHLKI